MKKTILYMMLGAITFTTSCVSEDHALAPWERKGNSQKALVLDLTADASFGYDTRALNEANYLVTDNYTVEIWNVDKNKLVQTWEKASDFDSKLLDTDTQYELKAYYGTEHPASRSEFRMEGSKRFRFEENGATQTVSVECAPTCGKVTTVFAETMATYFVNYSVAFGGTNALGTNTFAWAKADTDPWYVALTSGTAGETINYTITLKAKDAYANVKSDGTKATEATATGSFTLKRNQAHKLTISPNYTSSTEGGLSVTITIDESTNDKEMTIEVPVTWI